MREKPDERVCLRAYSSKPLLQHKVEMQVALHKHPGVAGVVEAAAEILKMVPGFELVDLN